jgi:ubiquinone/menaquinone biosynthesis C-methylase UbiE
MKREVAQRILAESKASYDKMAPEFAMTRARFWGELTFLAEHAMPGMNVLDIGCGNGRFFPVLRDRHVAYVGLDNSKGLLEEAHKQFPGVTFVEGDATALPFADRSFDIAFSFATIHHIPSKTLRRAFVKEAARVLKPGNTFIVTAWYLFDPPYRKHILTNALRRMCGLSTLGKTKHPRYLHAFTVQELTRLLRANGFDVVGSDIVAREISKKNKTGGKPTQRNILIVARKK